MQRYATEAQLEAHKGPGDAMLRSYGAELLSQMCYLLKLYAFRCRRLISSFFPTLALF